MNRFRLILMLCTFAFAAVFVCPAADAAGRHKAKSSHSVKKHHKKSVKGHSAKKAKHASHAAPAVVPA